MSRHALVLGASGVSGWECVSQLLEDYPKPGIWGRITGLTKRPMDEEDRSHWPWPEDKRLNLVSGIDLYGDLEEVLRQKFQEQLPDVNTVTHVYYLVHDPPPTQSEDPHAVSLGALRKTVTILDSLCPNLEFIVLQVGTFLYGTCFPDDFGFPLPLSESLPPLPAPFEDFFPFAKLREFMKQFSAGKKWSWCETRTSDIIGFVPRLNMYNIVYPLGMYIALHLFINGYGTLCPFPGSYGTYKALSNDGGANMIQKAAIYLSLLEDPAIKGQAFNVASSDTPSSWEVKWPAICNWYGVIGVPPLDRQKDKTETPSVQEFINAHQVSFESMAQKYQLKRWPIIIPTMSPDDTNWVFTKLTKDAPLSLEKLRKTGFTEHEDPAIAWFNSLEKMRMAKIIP